MDLAFLQHDAAAALVFLHKKQFLMFRVHRQPRCSRQDLARNVHQLSYLPRFDIEAFQFARWLFAAYEIELVAHECPIASRVDAGQFGNSLGRPAVGRDLPDAILAMLNIYDISHRGLGCVKERILRHLD